MAYTERGSIEPLSAGQAVEVRGTGNSMTPLLTSGQIVTVDPLGPNDELRKGDIVIAKVRGRVYMHLVRGLRGDQIQIGNNHGHINGWTPRAHVYGRVRR